MWWAVLAVMGALVGLGVYAISEGETEPYQGPRSCLRDVTRDEWHCDPVPPGE